MSTDLEIVDLTEIVGDMEICCDYSERMWHAGDLPAKWAGHLSVCSCGTGGQRLICTTCKDLLLSPATDSDGFECPGCDEVTVPARLAFARFEAL